MTIGIIFMIMLLVLVLVGAIPIRGSSGRGYGPVGGIGIVFLIVLILILLGQM